MAAQYASVRNAFRTEACDEPLTAKAMEITAKLNLRESQKALTRERILDAAREIFYREGYYGATVEQIVSAIGASRQTFYLHFADKEQLLAELIEAYTQRAVAYMERLPGPAPTLKDVRTWLVELAEFLEREKAVLAVVSEVEAHSPETPSFITATLDALMRSLSRRAQSFSTAIQGGAGALEARARANLLLLEIVWAAAEKRRGGEIADAAINIVAKAFYDFLHDKRFHPRKNAGASARKAKIAELEQAQM
jgi:AcrR family transcriptional regulator